MFEAVIHINQITIDKELKTCVYPFVSTRGSILSRRIIMQTRSSGFPHLFYFFSITKFILLRSFILHSYEGICLDAL